MHLLLFFAPFFTILFSFVMDALLTDDNCLTPLRNLLKRTRGGRKPGSQNYTINYSKESKAMENRLRRQERVHSRLVAGTNFVWHLPKENAWCRIVSIDTKDARVNFKGLTVVESKCECFEPLFERYGEIILCCACGETAPFQQIYRGKTFDSVKNQAIRVSTEPPLPANVLLFM